MADLWTEYATVQACAIAAMLLMYGRFWLFQASVGSFPRALLVFLVDGISISVLVLCFCVTCATVLHTLVGPTLRETSSLVAGITSLSETFLTGGTAMLKSLFEVSHLRPPCLHSQNLDGHTRWCSAQLPRSSGSAHSYVAPNCAVVADDSVLVQNGFPASPSLPVLLLRFFFFVLPIICVAMLQNFYVQSIVFAFQRAKSLYLVRQSKQSTENEEDKLRTLWQERLVRCRSSRHGALLCNV